MIVSNLRGPLITHVDTFVGVTRCWFVRPFVWGVGSVLFLFSFRESKRVDVIRMKCLSNTFIFVEHLLLVGLTLGCTGVALSYLDVYLLF
jgi:hypothetical protein